MTITLNTWPDTVKTALLGTNRAELDVLTGAKSGSTNLAKLLSQIPPQDTAVALLAIAGTVALHQQSGWQPAQTAPPTPTSPPPDQPICPPEISRQLDLLLEGSQSAILPELLAALALTGHRVPEYLLPGLLEKGAKTALIRPFLLPILGWHGRWLAGQNPAWGYASLAIESWSGLLAEWKTAVSTPRQALLRQLRFSQPERGRQILEQSWKSDPDLLRQQLIKILDHNLSLADEPFLETALDDRNHLVRRAAADLLARLPNSRLGQRMTQHAAGILRWTPNDKHAISVYLPGSFTPAMVRDGIPSVSQGDLAKVRARQLTQIIGRVPLAYWTDQWQKTPLEITQAALNSAWPRTLSTAFSTAAIRQNDETWAKALITTSQFNTSAGRLVPVLTADTCFALMQQAAQQATGLQRTDPLFIFLQHWQQPWSVEMGHFWLDLFVQHLQQNKDGAPEPTLNNLFKRFGQKCPPELADTAVSQLTIPGLSSTWQKTVRDLCQILQLRRNLLAEIHSLGLKPQDK